MSPEHMRGLALRSAAVRRKRSDPAAQAAHQRACFASVYLGGEIATEIRAEARRTGRTMSALIQTAWRIARRLIREGGNMKPLVLVAGVLGLVIDVLEVTAGRLADLKLRILIAARRRGR